MLADIVIALHKLINLLNQLENQSRSEKGYVNEQQKLEWPGTCLIVFTGEFYLAMPNGDHSIRRAARSSGLLDQVELCGSGKRPVG